MKKTYLTLFLMLAGTAAMTARTLSPQEALRRADSGKMVTNSVSRLVDTRMEDGLPVFYVFSEGAQSYRILSADDAGAPVLAVVDGQRYDAASIPPAMQYMLDCYAAEIAGAAALPLPLPQAAAASPGGPKKDILPLCSTKWDQGAPYNDECPRIDGKPTYTGCTATALAQILKYHNWPEKATGTHSYWWATGKQELSIDFAKVELDWENMLDSYASGSSAVQNAAVAALMKASGYMIDMAYGTDASGAFSELAPQALVEYFGYDKSAGAYYRDLYPTSEWQEMIYNNLRDCGPVLYSGYNNGEGGMVGHSFVCDGYDRASGLFHINWGWSGMSDGYFALSGLDPGSQGIGGSSAGYNLMQVAILGIRKNNGNPQQAPLVGSTDGLSAIALSGSKVGVQFQNVRLLSSYYLPSVEFGGKVVSADGEESIVASAGSNNLDYFWKGFNFDVSMDAFADGEYNVYPVFNTGDGVWRDMKFRINTPEYAIVKKSSGKCEVALPEMPTIWLENIDIKTPIYPGMQFRMEFDAVNDNEEEVYTSVAPWLYDGEKWVVAGTEMLVNVAAGETQKIEYVGSFAETLAAGSYWMYFFNANYDFVSEGVLVTVEAKPARTTISILSSAVVNYQATTSSGEPIVDPANVNMRATVSCTEGYFVGKATCYIYNASTLEYMTAFTSPTLYISKGETQDVVLKGSLPNVMPGERLIGWIWVGDQSGEYLYFTIGQSSGIDGVEVEPLKISNDRISHTLVVNGSGISQIEVYSMSGARMSLEGDIAPAHASLSTASLAPGVYVVKVTSDSGVTSQKFVR